jgi:hypothetical protein
MSKQAVQVWPLEDAPRALRALTRRVEGYVVRVPKALGDFIPPAWWLVPVEEHVLVNGDRVLIGGGGT